MNLPINFNHLEMVMKWDFGFQKRLKKGLDIKKLINYKLD